MRVRTWTVVIGVLVLAMGGCSDDAAPPAAVTPASSTASSTASTAPATTVPTPTMELAGKSFPLPVGQCLQKVWDDRVGEWNRLTDRRGYDSFEEYAKGQGWQTTLAATVREPAIVKACANAK